MEAERICRQDDFMCFAADLLDRWERRQAVAVPALGPEFAIPVERECLPCLIEDQE